MKTSVLGTLLVAAMLCGSASIALAADRPHKSPKLPNPGQAPASGAPTLVFNRQLKSTSFSFASADITVPASSFTPIDNLLKFTCPYASCTLTAELHVQFGGNTISGNDAALCAEFDGTFMAPGCPYTGEILTDGRFQEASFVFTQSGVTSGSHTLQGIAFADDGAIVGNYSIVYSLYTP